MDEQKKLADELEKWNRTAQSLNETIDKKDIEAFFRGLRMCEASFDTLRRLTDSMPEEQVRRDFGTDFLKAAVLWQHLTERCDTWRLDLKSSIDKRTKSLKVNKAYLSKFVQRGANVKLIAGGPKYGK